jgi:hypothetical protein
MSTEIQVRQTRLRLYITSKASEVMEAQKENPTTARAIIRAMEYMSGVEFQNPRTLMIEMGPTEVFFAHHRVVPSLHRLVRSGLRKTGPVLNNSI